MTTSLPSSSEDSEEPAGFGRLHPLVQRWVWEQGWSELRDIQAKAIAPILAADRDVIITAATAGGKTEAAALPICSGLVGDASGGVRALYVSPLKALINDQFDRLDLLCQGLGIPVHRWHGDVGSTHKKRLLTDPAGLLIITPESLEAMFVLRGTSLAKIFNRVGHVVVDELHSFIGSERGQQLQSLLSRLELVIRRRVPRIGLSATLGDMDLAVDFLRPGRQLPCEIIESSDSRQDVRLQIRGYRVTPSTSSDRRDGAHVDELDDAASPLVAKHLFDVLRGKDNLAFANNRRNVEIYADHLRRMCEQARVPNEFWPHHGSLSRELREHAEAVLKDPNVPASVICTTTLEMGIDVGTVETIAQIGVPPSVSALRQRLGRSGRRGAPSVVRIYIDEPVLEGDSPPQDRLRTQLVQAIAMVRLLTEKWCEPPNAGSLHLSTLVQQVLSFIAQYGGATAAEAWRVLCRDGAFSGVAADVFAELLRGLSAHDLVMQSVDGTLLLGQKGERLVNHYSFFAAFVTAEEYRLVCAGRELGTLPVSHPLSPGCYIIFGGARWLVLSVDADAKIVDLQPSPAGRAPRFDGGFASVHQRVRQEMRVIYESSELPSFLDAIGQELLAEGRRAYADYGLSRDALVETADGVVLFSWVGDRVLDTMLVQLRERELPVARDGVALVVGQISAELLRSHIRALAPQGPADAIELAATVSNKISEKHHVFLTESLLRRDYASANLDPEGAWHAWLSLAAIRG